MDDPKSVYLGLFMGQSNMAGRGNAGLAPLVPEGKAYEYRAITAPDRLCLLAEPFGQAEDNPDGVFEPGMKTGSMVSSFACAFEEKAPFPLVGISCAKGGSSIAEWQPGTPYFRDAVMRHRRCREFLRQKQIRIEGAFILWCQGCTDGDLGTPQEEYLLNAENTLESFLDAFQIDTCFLIQIGNHRDLPDLYRPIQEAQRQLAEKNPRIIMASTSLKTFAAKGLMKDVFHYTQEGYNQIGFETGRFVSDYFFQDPL